MGRKPLLAACISALLLFAIVSSAAAEEFEAEVDEVVRGDLLTIHRQGKAFELALYGVKCPTPGQPQGSEARQFTTRMALHQDIRVQVKAREDESKITGVVRLRDGTVLNHKLVQTGLASWDRRNAPNDIKLQTMEDSAKHLKLGIWSFPASAAGQPPVEDRPRSIPWALLFPTALALFAASALTLFFLFKLLRPRDKASAPPDPVPAAAAAEGHQRDEGTEALESGKHAIQDLLRSLSEFVSGLMENNLAYNDKMTGHKASIDQAMTMAGLEEIKRLLVHEIEEMQSTSEDYRRQLEHANKTIRDQQEIMERFRIDAKMDFLTKIANRRAFEMRLKEEFERAKRYRSIVTLIMIDIDHFKRVNDVYGHIVGDQVLRLVAHVLQDQTRFNDFVSRYGGEEFAVLLPESTAGQGRYVADKIRQAVENTSLLHAGERIKVTISAGVGQVDAERDTPETFIERVDAALYQAKENGRNRVEPTPD